MRLKKKTKYNARKVRDANEKIIADSIAEHDFSFVLDLREKAGDIRDIQKWPTVWLTDYIRYKPDYSYFEKSSNEVVYVDVKSVITAKAGRFAVIKELWKTHGPGPLEIVMKSMEAGRWTGKWSVKRIRPGGLELKRRRIKAVNPAAVDSKLKIGGGGAPRDA